MRLDAIISARKILATVLNRKGSKQGRTKSTWPGTVKRDLESTFISNLMTNEETIRKLMDATCHRQKWREARMYLSNNMFYANSSSPVIISVVIFEDVSFARTRDIVRLTSFLRTHHLLETSC